MEKSEVIGAVLSKMKEQFEANQEKEHQYVVAYYDDQENLLGYHADTFCNTVQDKLSAKRYSGENPYMQLATIRKNLEFTLDKTDEDLQKGMFKDIFMSVKNDSFKRLPKEKVFMYAEYLDPDAKQQRFKFKIM